MNATLETIWARRSIRRYQPQPIPESDLHLILEAARKAPTGSNRQNWAMVVVRDAALRQQMGHACHDQTWMADAGAILVLVTPPGEGKVNGTIVIDHAALAAASLGYGSCWVGWYDEAKVKETLGIPDEYGLICVLPVGAPAEWPEARPRKARHELFCLDRFGEPLDYTL
jgi:nitroreductase